MKSDQLAALERLAKKLNYGDGPAHPKQVTRLSLKVYEEFCRLGLLAETKKHRRMLRAASLLHDIGYAGDPDQEHNEAAFDMLRLQIPHALSANPLDKEEVSAILYCILWHRDSTFKTRRNVRLEHPRRVKKLASIMRVADALDRSQAQIVQDVSLSLVDGVLKFLISAKRPAAAELTRAREKADLMKKTFDVERIEFERVKAKARVKTER